MNLQNLFNQFIGSGNGESAGGNNSQGVGETLNKLTSNIPGGLVGGAAAGGIMALLMGNKSARKFAGKAAAYGGAAVLGGLAYKAFSNWQRNSEAQTVYANAGNAIPESEHTFITAETESPDFQLQLIKAMIAAARADGEIDTTEQQRIFDAVEQMDMSAEEKGTVFDLLRQPIPLVDLVEGVDTIEQKSEIYLASCMVINADHPSEVAHLNRLALTLKLPEGLAEHLQSQANQAIAVAA